MTYKNLQSLSHSCLVPFSSLKFTKLHCRLQRYSNSDCWSRRQACWPRDDHHCPQMSHFVIKSNNNCHRQCLGYRGVWPNVGIKYSNFFRKLAQRTNSIFIWNRCLSKLPKKSLHIWHTFSKKFVTKNIIKMFNLVTLLSCSVVLKHGRGQQKTICFIIVRSSKYPELDIFLRMLLHWSPSQWPRRGWGWPANAPRSFA